MRDHFSGIPVRTWREREKEGKELSKKIISGKVSLGVVPLEERRLVFGTHISQSLAVGYLEQNLQVRQLSAAESHSLEKGGKP